MRVLNKFFFFFLHAQVLYCYLPICVTGHPPLTSRLELISRGARIPLTVRRSILLPGKDFLSMLIKNDEKNQDIGTAPNYKTEESVIRKSPGKTSVVFNQERKTVLDVDNPVFSTQKRRNSFSYKIHTNLNRMEKLKNIAHGNKDNQLLRGTVFCDSDYNTINKDQQIDPSGNNDSTTELEPSNIPDNQIPEVSSEILTDAFNGRTIPDVPTTTILPVETTEIDLTTTHDVPYNFEPEKVISVRISSSVGKSATVPPNPNVTLITEDQPTSSGLTRSRFSIDESIPEITPVKYHSSVSTTAAGHSVRLYSSLHNNTQNVTERMELVPKNSTEEEKFEVETRVETVSYHQEVILNQQKDENSTQEIHHQEELVKKQNNSHYLHLPKRYEEPEKVYGIPEQNYEIEESVSVMSNGRVHGVQGVATESPQNDNNKFGYIVEGRDFRKYRIEERTSDGFIVGEYGVFRHDDGSLRGVRYTADSTTNPRLIYDALVKFLSL